MCVLSLWCILYTVTAMGTTAATIITTTTTTTAAGDAVAGAAGRCVRDIQVLNKSYIFC